MADDARGRCEGPVQQPDRHFGALHLPPDAFADPGSEEVVYAKTADRSVLGCMSDMAYMCEAAIAKSGSLRHNDLVALNRSLRRNINSARNYERPIDLTIARLGDR